MAKAKKKSAQSKITQGSMTFTVDGEDYTLTANLQAAIAIQQKMDSFGLALDAMKALNIEGMAVIWMASGNATSLQKGREAVFEIGTINLMAPLTEYIMLLTRGGRPLPEPTDEIKEAIEEVAAGNA